MKQQAMLLVAVLTPLLFASCVVSKKPLSDEKTSKVDSHLIGTWDQVKEAGTTYLTIRKKPGTSNVMQWIELPTDKRKKTPEKRYDMFAKPGKTAYLSMGLERDGYLIGKYTTPDAKTFELHLLDKWVVGKAVEDGKLKGVARRNNDGEYTSVSLSDPPEKIIKYIEKNAATCFAREPLVFKKRKAAEK